MDRIPPRVRKLIALSELLGGGALLIGVPLGMLFGISVAGWYFALMEVLGVITLLAGYWLWRGDVRGEYLSRPIQALQILHVQTHTLIVSFNAGLGLKLIYTWQGISFKLEMNGSLWIIAGTDLQPTLALNVFALFAFLVVSGAVYRRVQPSGGGSEEPNDFDHLTAHSSLANGEGRTQDHDAKDGVAPSYTNRIIEGFRAEVQRIQEQAAFIAERQEERKDQSTKQDTGSGVQHPPE